MAELATHQHGVVALGHLEACGLSRRAVAYRGEGGSLHRVHRGVYAVGHPRLSVDGRRMAAVLACGPNAVLSHRSAAGAWGLRPTARARIEVTTTDRGRRGPPAIELHRVRHLDARDTTRLRAIPITTVARTLVDLAGILDPDALADAMHEAEVKRLLDVEAVEAAIDRANGRRGTTALRAALEEPSTGPTRSELERRFRALCRSGGLPPARLNQPLIIGDRELKPDALWPAQRVIVEVDGEDVHRTRRGFHQDRRRDAALAAEGYVVVRFTWQRIAHEHDQVLAELRRLLALRARSA